MLYSALMFLVVGLIAGALNLGGVSTVAIQISWILFLIGLLVTIHVFMGRPARVVRPRNLGVLE
jgi:uncharacterized membrane protein YtjA (UPF0391 family)